MSISTKTDTIDQIYIRLIIKLLSDISRYDRLQKTPMRISHWQYLLLHQNVSQQLYQICATYCLKQIVKSKFLNVSNLQACVIHSRRCLKDNNTFSTLLILTNRLYFYIIYFLGTIEERGIDSVTLLLMITTISMATKFRTSSGIC